MDISGALYTTLDPFSPTIQNKLFLLGLFRAGAPSEILVFCLHTSQITRAPRCRACPEELDSIGKPRYRAYTIKAHESFTDAHLWEDHGIAPDVIVCVYNAFTCRDVYAHAHSHLLTIFRVRIFTSSSRQTFSIRLSRGHSKTTWWLGSYSMLSPTTRQLKPNAFWMI